MAILRRIQPTFEMVGGKARDFADVVFHSAINLNGPLDLDNQVMPSALKPQQRQHALWLV